MKYVFNPYLQELFHNHQVIVANTKTGDFLKTSKAYYHVLKDMVIAEETEAFLIPTESTAHAEIIQNLSKLFHQLLIIGCILPENHLAHIYKEPLDVVYLALTNKCNLRCKHCSASADINFTDVLTTEKIKEIIEQLVLLKPKAINVTGGEPMMHADIMDILAHLRSKFDGTILLSTNGLFINDKNSRQLPQYVDNISFSVDGYDEESCANIRGKGVFNRVIKSIKRLQSKGFQKISLSMTITSYTIDEGRERFHNLCAQLQVEPIVRVLTSAGRAGENSKEIFPKKPIEDDSAIQELSCRLCSPGKRELFIGGDGNIYPCGGLMDSGDFILGTVFDDNLIELVASANTRADYSRIDQVRPWNVEPCSECNVNLFCHHCISNIHYLQLNQPLFESVCQTQKKQLQQLVWKE